MFIYIKIFSEEYHKQLCKGLQNIQISKKLTHTLRHQDLTIILMDTPGYFLQSLYFLKVLPTIIFFKPYLY